MARKDGRYKGPHLATRRAMLDMLKVEGELTSQWMAEQLGISTMAVRQHLQELEALGEVIAEDRALGKGRPTKYWRLTELASRHFADRHRDLMLDLLGQLRAVLGEEALDKLLDARGSSQVAAYRARLDEEGSFAERITALARIRSEEGYMATAESEGDGVWRLLENHCPICAAASACSGLCDRELEVFKESLGPECSVAREEHLLSGARRCSYRIERKAK